MNIEEVVTRGVQNIIPSTDKLKTLLASGKKLNVYLGIDPTTTKIHLGHAAPLRKLQSLSQMGHHVTFLIGDFTALIGDTSDKDTERPVLTPEQIRQNFATYKKQAEKILDFSKIDVRFNSEWLSKLTFQQIIELCQHFSAGDFVGRELIKKRLDGGKKVGLHELMYPVMQGYDSYFLDTDIQLGGTDQTFNMQAGRTLQKDLRQKESFIIANSFLVGTDGRKMSKSWGNGIWLEDEPGDMFGKVMSLSDDLIIEYFTLATDMPIQEISEIKKSLAEGQHPMDIKKALAVRIVTELHDVKAAKMACEFFESTVQRKELPSDPRQIKLVDGNHTTLSLVTQAKPDISKSEARRLIEQGGVELNGKKHFNALDQVEIETGSIMRIGKREYYKIIL